VTRVLDAPAQQADPTRRARQENFPVALRILPAKSRRHLMGLYAFARHVDDLGDEPAPWVDGEQRLARLADVEADLRGLYGGRPAHHPAVRGLAPAVREAALPLPPLLRLIESNRIDQRRTSYQTFDELTDYCRFSANPVGELVLHLFGQADPHRVALSDRVCTALQLIEHLQDIGQDYRRGRVYLPAADLKRFGVTAADLSLPAATDCLRRLVRFQADRAHAWLEAGAPLAASLRRWPRLAVRGYLAGGRAALAALAGSGYDPLPGPPRPVWAGTLRQLLAASMRSAG
jgi:squalene synthase HpnC